MGHTASAHDSTVFKFTLLYNDINRWFDYEEYILVDKAYALEWHIITPYKDPITKKPPYSRFNSALSVARVKIEHAFGIPEARWTTLYDVPIRIIQDIQAGHEKVQIYTFLWS